VHPSPRVEALSICPYANFTSPCPTGWLKYSEVYRVPGARGAVRGSCPFVKEGCPLSPLPCGPGDTTPVRAIIRTHVITGPGVVSPHIHLPCDVQALSQVTPPRPQPGPPPPPWSMAARASKRCRCFLRAKSLGAADEVPGLRVLLVSNRCSRGR
jgi:hypothetical protein